MVAALGWFAVGCIYAIQENILRKYDLTAENNLRARRIHTQFQLFRRIAIGFVVIIDIGAILWTFDNPEIWRYGSGLLASAGIASLILATAAKSTASNLFAGLQIAISQPIRLDDVVVVQGEWGRIEEINSAYVVVKIWDLRRLVVPLSYFIENSFQNWTRESSDIMGTAFLYVDYSIPVDILRQQLNTIVDASHLWDNKVCSLQVTNLTDRVMELRCLVSSRNSSENFDLRCLVREQMTAFIQQNYPEAFPLTRSVTRPGAPPHHHSTPPNTPPSIPKTNACAILIRIVILRPERSRTGGGPAFAVALAVAVACSLSTSPQTPSSRPERSAVRPPHFAFAIAVAFDFAMLLPTPPCIPPTARTKLGPRP